MIITIIISCLASLPIICYGLVIMKDGLDAKDRGEIWYGGIYVLGGFVIILDTIKTLIN